MLLISHLNQEDLCALHGNVLRLSAFPSSTKCILQNPHGKMRTCPRDTFRDVWSHGKGRQGGSPHVTDIIPVIFFRVGSNEEQAVTNFPLRRARLKKFLQRMAHAGIGGETASDPRRAPRMQKLERPWPSPAPRRLRDAWNRVGEVLLHSPTLLLRRALEVSTATCLWRQALGTAGFASS